ncbi:MAG: phosphate signaling complex protein PhoU [Fimbriimonadaceae bacterium]|nr:phosphate signaling complex protein PhoU [Fimbriimonadaceae bacterium]
MLEEELQALERSLLEMGSLADTMVVRAVDALCALDVEAANEVVRSDDVVDRLDIEIEGRCLRLLALQQPMAGDLRVIGTSMKMITDLERIGDLAVDIAKTARKVEGDLGTTDFIDLRKMADVALHMLRLSLDAFVRRDLEIVAQVCRMDDEVDDLYRTLRGQIHNRMREHPDEDVAASWLLLSIHHLERVADHAVNIAERVSFMVTGKLEQLASSHKSE